MSADELEQFKYQLSEVTSALQKDPSNAELLSLKGELEDLVSLLSASLPAQEPAPPAAKPKPTPSASSSSAAPSPAPKPVFRAGDDCSCRYSDGRWYPARITQISGSTDDPVYTVVFKGFDVPETVTAQQIRAASKWDNGAEASRSAGAAGEKRKAEAGGGKLDDEKERKRKKNEKKAETQKAKAEEQGAKQKSWQSFAKKGAKKGIHIPGVQGASSPSCPLPFLPSNPLPSLGESMFRSPADMTPSAKGASSFSPLSLFSSY